MKQTIVRFSTACFLLLTAACTGYAPTDRMMGDSREQVIQIMGKPTFELVTPDGQIMQYPRGPFGKHTYFVHLDRNGVMLSWTQVLNEKNFNLIQPDMNRDEVVAIIGESRDTFGLARSRGYVWNYRYVNTHCFWFQIEFTIDDKVRSTGYGRPPECRARGK